MTISAKLVAKRTDYWEYTTYVFESLEENPPFGRKYVMCTRFPNWDHCEINLDEEGFLTAKEVEAGVDEWFDGENFHPYNYSNIIFEKFIKKPKKEDKELIL